MRLSARGRVQDVLRPLAGTSRRCTVPSRLAKSKHPEHRVQDRELPEPKYYGDGRPH